MFVVRYEGGDAEQHVLDMRRLGESLIGIERLINTGLYVLEHGERPGHGRVLKSVVRVSTPQPGSLEFIPDLLGGVYPLVGRGYCPEAHRSDIATTCEYSTAGGGRS